MVNRRNDVRKRFFTCFFALFLISATLSVVLALGRAENSAEIAPESALPSEEEGGAHFSADNKAVFAHFSERQMRFDDTVDETVFTPYVPPEKPSLVYLGVFRCTAYCPCYKCCEGYALNRPKDENGNDIVYGASGRVLYPNYSVAVDPRVIPYGTHLMIGGHEYVAADCGGGINGSSIDVYFATHAETYEWGLRYLDVYMIV